MCDFDNMTESQYAEQNRKWPAFCLGCFAETWEHLLDENFLCETCRTCVKELEGEG